MRLINTSTGLFEEFIGRNIPPYAILSHTWEEEEVSFQDMRDSESYKSKKGYQKIYNTCQLAAQRDIKYAWIDTCCIDKSSSAELTEAINSMYRWYQRSLICFTYLSDLPSTTLLDTALRGCRWFSRGWTLQELIAPTDIQFFDQDWHERGSKQDLVENLAKITGIKIGVLCHEIPLSSVAVAQRMSWASNRITTRIEDIAYCLLGIFDVNMPLLYGEEEKAFQRLQEEIIKSIPDLSIFAWTYPLALKTSQNPTVVIYSGFLAQSPALFHQATSLEKRPGHDWRELSISNSSVKTQAQILYESIPGKRGHRYLLPLNCSHDPSKILAIRLRKCGLDHFIREDPSTIFECAKDLWPSNRQDRYLLYSLGKKRDPYSDMSFLIGQTRSHVLQIQLPDEWTINDVRPWDRSYDDQDISFFGVESSDVCSVRISAKFIRTSGRREIYVNCSCMLYAVGWSSLNVNDLQCSIMVYNEHATALKNLQAEIVDSDHNSSQIIHGLIHHKIPKLSAAIYKIPNMKTIAVVSFTPRLVDDEKICQNRFWRIEFDCRVYKEADLPEVKREKWVK